MSDKKQSLVLLFCIFAILFRIIPHPPNFVPITALALFGSSKNKVSGAYLSLLVMFVSDIFLGFSMITPFVYGSFILISILFNEINVKNVLTSSLLFFIITNFGVWILGYPQTIEGLLMCYTLAIPFFVNSILGDLFFSYLLKHSYNYTEKRLWT
jgi:hypothetical protein